MGSSSVIPIQEMATAGSIFGIFYNLLNNNSKSASVLSEQKLFAIFRKFLLKLFTSLVTSSIYLVLEMPLTSDAFPINKFLAKHILH